MFWQCIFSASFFYCVLLIEASVIGFDLSFHRVRDIDIDQVEIEAKGCRDNFNF